MPRPAEVRFRAGELELAGELVLPDLPAPPGRHGRYPWVLLLGSWLARDRNGAFDRVRHPTWFAEPVAGSPPGLLARIAVALADSGVASFRYDPRGCGLSGGEWPTSDLFSRIDDARDALGALRGRRDLDLARTGLVGHGEGAAVALSVAIADPAISALTLVGASARGFRDVLRRGVAERERTGAERAHRLVAALDRGAEELIERADRRERTIALGLGHGERVELDLAGWRQLFDTPPLALTTMLHRSIGLVHGADDAWSHPDESRLLAATLAASGSAPDVQVIPGAGHDLAEAGDRVMAALATDLAARLLPRDLPPVLVALQELE